MRSMLYLAATVLVIALAYWAYNENYATQSALKKVDRLQRQIASQRERLGVLRAEWAYLNRPDRLRDLVDLNYDKLRLIPLAPQQFGTVKQVTYPRVDPRDVRAPVDLSATTADPLVPGPDARGVAK